MNCVRMESHQVTVYEGLAVRAFRELVQKADHAHKSYVNSSKAQTLAIVVTLNLVGILRMCRPKY